MTVSMRSCLIDCFALSLIFGGELGLLGLLCHGDFATVLALMLLGAWFGPCVAFLIPDAQNRPTSLPGEGRRWGGSTRAERLVDQAEDLQEDQHDQDGEDEPDRV